MKHLLTILLILKVCFFVTAQENKISGFWTLTDTTIKSSNIIDTIFFETDNTLKIPYKPNRIATGKWKSISNKKYKLKINAETSKTEKVKQRKLIWEINWINSVNINIIQYSDTDTVFLSYKKEGEKYQPIYGYRTKRNWTIGYLKKLIPNEEEYYQNQMRNKNYQFNKIGNCEDPIGDGITKPKIIYKRDSIYRIEERIEDSLIYIQFKFMDACCQEFSGEYYFTNDSLVFEYENVTEEYCSCLCVYKYELLVNSSDKKIKNIIIKKN